MKQWPNNLQKLITHFGRLPGIGPKMAERIVLNLLTQPKQNLSDFSESIKQIMSVNIHCQECNTLSENSICSICSSPTRNKTKLLITSDPVSAFNIESSGKYPGLYFILGGLLNPIEGVTPTKLKINKLLAHLKKTPEIKEVIFAFNANVEGEATLLYLKKLLSSKNFVLSRLARGLPMGGDLTYTDEVTLSAALEERQIIK